jgi:hypothetical protein
VLACSGSLAMEDQLIALFCGAAYVEESARLAHDAVRAAVFDPDARRDARRNQPRPSNSGLGQRPPRSLWNCENGLAACQACWTLRQAAAWQE